MDTVITVPNTKTKRRSQDVSNPVRLYRSVQYENVWS